MSAIYEEIGRRIRQCRTTYNGAGISQEVLATKIGTNTNSISRWESATSRPAISDIEDLANFFGVPISYFLPEAPVSSKAAALVSAIQGLNDNDLEEVIRYALFRRAVNPVPK